MTIFEQGIIYFILLCLFFMILSGLLFYWYQMRFAECIFPSNVKYRLYKPKNEKNICLTIDDVPYNLKTFENILDVLDMMKINVVFFVIGELITLKSKPLLIRAVRAGHILANHGMSDSKHADLDFIALSGEIMNCQGRINQIYSDACVLPPNIKYYRPGCGVVNKTIKYFCKLHNYEIVLGSNYPSDAQIKYGWLNKLYILYHLHVNDIIILHDRPWTSDYLSSIIINITKRNYKFSLLD